MIHKLILNVTNTLTNKYQYYNNQQIKINRFEIYGMFLCYFYVRMSAHRVIKKYI